MNLTQGQLKRFKTDHFMTIDSFFGRDEVSALQAEMERLKHAGHFRNVATDRDGKTISQTNVNLQLFGMYEFSPLIRALPFESKILEVVSQLIGDPVVFQHDQCFLKPARHGSGTNWHQDNAYATTTTDPVGGVAMWIAVHDATVANGTLQVVPGMATERLKHVRDPESDHHIRCYPDETRAMPCELKAGGVVFFNHGTPHCTRGNATDKDRAGIAIHFVREDCASLILKSSGAHPYLTGARASDGTKEFGVCVAGTWRKEVERTLNASLASSQCGY